MIRERGIRRAMRYSLRGLLALVLVCAVASYRVHLQIRSYQKQQKALARLNRESARCKVREATPKWLWRRLVPGAFPWAGDVTEVKITVNPEESDVLRCLADLENLEHLEVFGEGGSDEIFAEALAPLRRLRVVMINSPTIGDRGFRGLAGCNDLEFLYLPHANISDTAMQTLHGFPRLRKLDLSRTSVTDAGFEPIVSLSNLHSLRLPETVTSKSFEKLRVMPGLYTLEIRLRELSDGDLSALQNLPNLHQLEVRGRGFTRESVASVSKLRSLKSLTINDADIGVDDLSALKDLPQLEWLGLRDTLVTEADVLRHLVGLLPGVQINGIRIPRRAH